MFWTHCVETARAFGLALSIVVAGGISIGVIPCANRFAGDLFVPTLIGFASVPKVVLYPLVLLTFGLGVSAKVAFGVMFAARLGLGYLLMTAIGLRDVALIMSLTFVVTTIAVCASAVLLSVDRRLRRHF